MVAYLGWHFDVFFIRLTDFEFLFVLEKLGVKAHYRRCMDVLLSRKIVDDQVRILWEREREKGKCI